MDYLARIRSALSAMELRRQTAVTLLVNGGDYCKIFLRNRIYTVPLTAKEILEQSLYNVHQLSAGFVGLALEPDGVQTIIAALAESIEAQEDEWEKWSEEWGLDHLSYDEAMQIVAINAVWFLH